MELNEICNKDSKEIFELFQTSFEGLSQKEAQARQKIYGLNEIKAKEIGAFQILLRQIKSPFFYLLFLAGLISFLIGENINGILIFVFAFINIFLTFFQEYKAKRNLLILKKYFPPETNVFRDGKEIIIDKKFLVPGDLVILGVGDIVPADLRIVEEKGLLVDESVLTGESEPIFKTDQKIEKEFIEIFEAKNILFAGTLIVSGKAKGIVFRTGLNTQTGKIQKTVIESEKITQHQKEIEGFSKVIIRFIVATIVFLFLFNFFIKRQENQLEFLIFCLALLVGLVPEALPVVVGVSLSGGALELAKKNLLVKRLTAIEDLGNIEILCTDKTGTITENKLKLQEIISQNPKQCLYFSFFASSLLEKEISLVKDPFDLAIFEKAKSKEKELRKARILSEIPFSPQRLRNSVLVEWQKERYLIVRGAPEKILELSKISEEEKEEILKRTEKEGKKGKRVLGVGFKKIKKNDYSEEDEKELEFLGCLTFFDPLKKTARPTIELAKKLGIRVKILTGDSPQVAWWVAYEAGLIKEEKEVILGKEIEKVSPEEFDILCEKYSVFARVLPETKLKIIKSLQKKYEVGFVGEGINDAPALKIANVSIVVREGAEISKEISDIILLKDDLKTIIEGIKRGRNIFLNIQKYLKATLASNFGNMYSMAGISLIFPFLPMLPVQVLLLNLLSDLPLVSIVTDTSDYYELKKPKKYQFSKIFNFIFLLALVSSFFDFVFFGIFYERGEKSIQTHWFLLSVLTELLIILSVRTQKPFFYAKKPSNIIIYLGLFVFFVAFLLPFTYLGQNLFGFIKPNLSTILIVGSLGLAYLTLTEIVKLFYFKHQK